MEAAELESAWGEVRARWGDEGAHRAFLDRCRTLEMLAEAGRRYRGALEAAPDDAAAARWIEEVVRRASALAFAQAPRPGRSAAARTARRVLWLALGAFAALVVAWLATRGAGARP